MAGDKSRSTNLYYVNGMTLANIKKVSEFWFGDLFISARKDRKNWTFEILLDDETEDWQINKFRDYWRVTISLVKRGVETDD